MINLVLPKSINIGFIEIHFYGIIVGISIAIIYLNLQKFYKQKYFTLLFALSGIVSLIFGRLAFILLNLNEIDWTLNEIIRVDHGGILIWGVLIGMIIGSLFSAKILKINFLNFLDNIFSIIPLAQAFGRIANFINQELFGKPTDLFWGIFIEKQNRPDIYKEYEYFHPLFFYEAFLNILSYFLIKKLSNKKDLGFKTGLFLINYGVIRLFLNRIRIDFTPTLWIFGGPDFFAVIFIVMGLIFINQTQIRRLLKLPVN